MKMMDEVRDTIQKINYITPVRFISGRIVEYDMASANISTMREANIISQERYDYLSKLPKIMREREVGLMEKDDPGIYTKIQEGIRNAKLQLVDSNNITNIDSIIRVANDAVYINSNIDLKYTKFGEYIFFKKKSEYNNMTNLGKAIIFLNYLPDGNISVDVKGIGDKLYLHENYILNIFVSTIVLLERSGIEASIDYLTRMVEDYLQLRLPVGYYREFDSISTYRVKTNNSFLEQMGFGLPEAFEQDKFSLDINYNYNLLRELWSILIDIYNRRR